jgi:hypothetical protein
VLSSGIKVLQKQGITIFIHLRPCPGYPYQKDIKKVLLLLQER